MTDLPNDAETIAALFGEQMIALSRHLDELQEHSPERYRPVISHLGLDSGTAETIAAVMRPFRTLLIDPARLERIGWPCLRLISPLVDAGNWRDLVAAAETHSANRLLLLIAQGVVGSGRRSVLLTFTAEQHAMFESALMAHGANRVAGALSGRERALFAVLAKATRDLKSVH